MSDDVQQVYEYTFGGILFEVWATPADGWAWVSGELDSGEAGFLTHAEARKAAERRALEEAMS